ncbi:MAG: DUF6951 family protein [Candidatus Methanomethylophilaceae archaeon]|jgi:hypothetical protein
MSECNIDIQPGVCKLKTKIKATMNDDMRVVFDVESDCADITRLAETLGSVDPFQNICVKFSESEVYRAADDIINHTACPVPCAFMKAIEVASGMGLKADVIIEIK